MNMSKRVCVSLLIKVHDLLADTDFRGWNPGFTSDQTTLAFKSSSLPLLVELTLPLFLVHYDSVSPQLTHH
jgi:hypothetical protein